jgi:hypothetical protein
MSKTPSEPTNSVLEQLRLIRAEVSAMRAEEFTRIDRRFGKLEEKVSNIERDLRGLKLDTIAEVYKANLTVASFVDHER